jgi:hypothetical protein
MPGYIMINHVRSGQFRLDQVRSCYVRRGQFKTVKYRLALVSPG